MNIKIRGIEVFHPENVVNNEYYIEHFRNQGKEIGGLLKALGREDRYIINDKEENTLTMGIKVVNKLLKKENIKGDEIDIIIFTSQVPEYTFPTQASIIHAEIKGNKDAMLQDVNVNCIGMISAYETACRLLMSNDRMKRALIIGSDFFTVHCNPDDENTYPLFGDCSCAMILEKTDEENIGFIDSLYESDTIMVDKVLLPACGSSKSYESNAYDRKISWETFDTSFHIDLICRNFNTLLERNGLKSQDVKKFCLSQFTDNFGKGVSEMINRPIEDFIYIGDKYGYTGTSSPFISLYEGLESGRIKKGDIVFLWSIGLGWTACSTLIKI